ncbi:hypothetical protein CO612_07510 [Lysobacteraceae bacterium NML71-0210]|nr:hypothetical protein CO612_07510 [Xanthomonadaceae bacterium NML71-0210]
MGKETALADALRYAKYPAFLAPNGGRANSHRYALLKHALPSSIGRCGTQRTRTGQKIKSNRNRQNHGQWQ